MIITEILPLEYRAPTDLHIKRLQAQRARDTEVGRVLAAPETAP